MDLDVGSNENQNRKKTLVIRSVCSEDYDQNFWPGDAAVLGRYGQVAGPHASYGGFWE